MKNDTQKEYLQLLESTHDLINQKQILIEKWMVEEQIFYRGEYLPEVNELTANIKANMLRLEKLRKLQQAIGGISTFKNTFTV